jgi:GNAT superfamily N-acetyltransferase
MPSARHDGPEVSRSADGEYVEAPRSYWSLAWTFAALVAGFLVDLLLGGGVAHLPGWAIAFGVLVGVHALLVHAVRSEKTLRVGGDEIRIGDEAIARSDVRDAVALDDDAPVLGWPTGRPRSVDAVTLRLTDGRRVSLPTRRPELLLAALGVPASSPASDLEVRAAATSDLAELPDIDERADIVFRLAGYDLPELPFDAEALRRAKAVFVAGRPPIGFGWIEEIDGLAHIDEIAVVPGWMRRGVGTRLLERACTWAAAKGYAAITLTTYADVPWNGPYYAARGFSELSQLTPGLAAIRERERDVGLDAVGRRIAMRRELADSAD